MKASALIRVVVFGVLSGCIEPIDYDVPAAGEQLVVDGSITNEPGPYMIRLSRNQRLKTDLDYREPVDRAIVRIVSDAGEDERLTETLRGVYVTNQIVGTLGRTYTLHITTPDLHTYISTPQTIRAPGEILELSHEFEQRTRVENGIEVPDDRFNIFLDARSEDGSENFLRWRTKGTYKIATNPELITINVEGQRIPDPPPCSGWELRSGGLTQVGECTCCICWVTDFEPVPQVSDEQFIAGNEFRHVRVGSVPVTRETFYEKYHISVSQMSLSREIYDYFRLIRAQKEGAVSLFQPAGGKLRSNISRTNGEEEVLGIFWAAGVNTSTIFINRDDLPYYLEPPAPIIRICNTLQNSTATQPTFWE
jgi:hypothetical protein